MTREEAIEILKQFKKCLSDIVFDEKGSEAWQMAISALENHDKMMKVAYEQGKKDALEQICDNDCEHCTWTECPKELCDDAISRQDVLDLVAGEISHETYEDIYSLPSVTQKSGKWIELPKALDANENPCKCSACGHILSFMHCYPKSNYCPNCGAKMESEDKE